jgi:hypothetical protein
MKVVCQRCGTELWDGQQLECTTVYVQCRCTDMLADAAKNAWTSLASAEGILRAGLASARSTVPAGFSH